MFAAIHAAFFAGVALQVTAAVTAGAGYFLHGASGTRLFQGARYVSVTGAALMGVVLALRWVYYGRIPLTSGIESLTLFVIMVAINAAVITADRRRLALVLVYLPALGLLSMIAALVGTADLTEPPKPLSALLLLLHVVPAFMAYALFFVAMLTSAVYLFQARRLKQHRTTGIFQLLPSLANLDSVLFGLIRIGYPLFMVTLVMGLYWTWYDRALLGPLWFASPKILLSYCMAALYAACFHGRSRGALRGPKLAMLLAAGFGALLGAYLVLELLTLTNYNFWDDAA
jgi:HemX protein